jgi:hypothetical protein
VSNNSINTLKVITEIVFHPRDVKLEMEYQLYLYVSDILGKEDNPILISNSDRTKIHRISKEHQIDDFLC